MNIVDLMKQSLKNGSTKMRCKYPSSKDKVPKLESLALSVADLHCRIPNLVAKPKILVCAPSNAAADELLQRIMNEGFSDAEVSF